MANFEDYRADTGFNNLVIQRALRGVDTQMLGLAMAGLPEDTREMFYRNMAKHVGDACREAIEEMGKVSRSRIESAQVIVLRVLGQAAENSDGEELPPDTGPEPEIRLDSQEEIIGTFRALSSFARRNGFLALERLEETNVDPFFRRGIELLSEGWEPLLQRSLLEKHKAAALQSFETRLDMIIDGIDALAGNDWPQFVEVKLRAYTQPF